MAGIAGMVLAIGLLCLALPAHAAGYTAVYGTVYYNGAPVGEGAAYVYFTAEPSITEYTLVGGKYTIGSANDQLAISGGTVRAVYNGHYHDATFPAGGTPAGTMTDIWITSSDPGVYSAAFSASTTSPTVGYSVGFYDQSGGAAGVPGLDGWAWDFGDGSANGTTQNPSHTYNAPGTYDVTLTITGVTGGSRWYSTLSKASYITVQSNAQTGPYFRFPSTSYSFQVSNATITIPVDLVNANAFTIYSVEYSTTTSSAAPGVDYVQTSGTLNFAAGETSKTITVQLLDSGTSSVGYNKVFSIQLSSPTNAGLSSGFYITYITLLSQNNGSVTNGPIRVWFSSGRIATYDNVQLEVHTESYEGNTIASVATGSDGMASITSSVYGQHVYCHATYTGAYTVADGEMPSSYGFDVKFSFSPNEQDYYVDVLSPTTCNVMPASVAASYPLHAVAITVMDRGTEVAGVPVQFYTGTNYDILLYSKITDDSGDITISPMTNTKFKVRVCGSYNKDFYYTFPNSAYTINAGTYQVPNPLGFIGDGVHWIVNAFSGMTSNINSTSGQAYGGNGGGFCPQGVYGGAHAITEGAGSPAIYCWANDSSERADGGYGLATTFDYNLTYTPIGSNISVQVQAVTMTGSNESHVAIGVTDPYNKNYLLHITAHQPGGLVNLYYMYYWPGPTWRLPGVPVSLYPWISIGIIGAVFLGTASRRNIGIAGITGTIATAFIAGSGWMAAWGPSIWGILLFCIVMSVLFYWRQAMKGEV